MNRCLHFFKSFYEGNLSHICCGTGENMLMTDKTHDFRHTVIDEASQVASIGHLQINSNVCKSI